MLIEGLPIEEGQRVSKQKITAMSKYLRKRGYSISVYSEVNTSNWIVRINNMTYKLTENVQAFRILKPFVDKEQEIEYSEYIQRKNKRYLDQMRAEQKEKAKNKNFIHG